MKLQKLAASVVAGMVVVALPISSVSASVRASDAVPAKVSTAIAKREVGKADKASNLGSTGVIIAVLALAAVVGGVVAATNSNDSAKSS